MSVQLLNSGDLAVAIPVIGPNGEREDVQLQPRGGRLTLPLGYKVDPTFAASAVNLRVYLNGTPLNKTQGE